MFCVGRRNAAGDAWSDARSLARMHLRDLRQRIEAVLKGDMSGLDDTTRAHLEECQERITKLLNASLQASTP